MIMYYKLLLYPLYKKIILKTSQWKIEWNDDDTS